MLLDRLPIYAIDAARAARRSISSRTLLELAGYRDLAEDTRATDGLNHMFRGRDAQSLARSSEGGAMPLVAAGGELIAGGRRTRRGD